MKKYCENLKNIVRADLKINVENLKNEKILWKTMPEKTWHKTDPSH